MRASKERFPTPEDNGQNGFLAKIQRLNSDATALLGKEAMIYPKS
jgi:hypothetical protein